jgi:hypothetical protein
MLQADYMRMDGSVLKRPVLTNAFESNTEKRPRFEGRNVSTDYPRFEGRFSG